MSILTIFLISEDIEPWYSYRLYDYKKNRCTEEVTPRRGEGAGSQSQTNDNLDMSDFHLSSMGGGNWQGIFGSC